MITNLRKPTLNTIDVRYVKGVGPVKAEILKKLGIETVEDLFYHLPRRYEDRSKFNPVSEVKVGEYATIKAEVLTMGLRRAGKGMNIFQLAVGDDTGVIYAVWFNQPYMKNLFKVGDKIILYGKVERYKDLQINTPEVEILKEETDETIHMGRIVPIYPLTEGLSQRAVRSIMKNALDKYSDYIEDPLPVDVRARNSLLDLKQAINNMHFPESDDLRKSAYERIVFSEFFVLQLALALRRARTQKGGTGIAHKTQGELLESFIEFIPFELTEAQKRTIDEIKRDMADPKPMNRLLEGDVGSGKTIVATYALVLTVSNGYQGALMAPTEILAEQHFKYLSRLLRPSGINIVLLTNSVAPEEREEAQRMIEDGTANIVVGTHALIQEDVKFRNLGLAVIDEQHRFGVDQRARMKEKGLNPDMLYMTATPIPRTLAMTLYGDLDLSILDQMPEGRIPSKAYLVGEERRQGIYKFIEQEAKTGRQALIIYPVIEKGKKIGFPAEGGSLPVRQGGASGGKAATEMYIKFKEEIFPNLKVGLIHGRIGDEQKDKVMTDFMAGRIDILVSTSVVEVGIDNPKVSVMLIENPERFGLSQLHQLRGRIGRGGQKSYCILLSDTGSEEATKRLKALVSTSSGFSIAEKDLQIRGSGEFFGTKQHGLPELRYANLVSDVKQLEAARREAFRWVEEDSELSDPRHNLMRQILKRQFGDRLDLTA